MMATANQVKQALREHVEPGKVALPRFFKSSKGDYAEGDRYLGVVVPIQRKVARRFQDLSQRELAKLLDDVIHECRLTALLIMVEQFRRGDEEAQQAIVELYFKKMDRVNNWDLVDSSAYKILGPYLQQHDRKVLVTLARSGRLWHQRIAMIATLHFIKQSEFDDALTVAEILVKHDHDLIHKAVGWMLREIGNRDRPVMLAFLEKHYVDLSRTTIRYAIERLPERRRKQVLRGKFNSA